MNREFSHVTHAGRWIVLLPVIWATLQALPALAGDALLQPGEAFQASARMADARTVEARFKVAPGYYMYRERFRFASAQASLGTPGFPAGSVHFDATFEKQVETYRDEVTIRIPVVATGSFAMTMTSQGCSDQGVCYAPMTSTVSLATPGAGPEQDPPASGIDGVLGSGRLLLVLPMFFLLGLGLSFTPCVLPMLPILSSIIVGKADGKRRLRGLALSLSYCLGMALVYTAMGIAAGLAGKGLAAALQNPWVLGGFAVVMALMAAAMFGLYELQMPAAIQARVTGRSSGQADTSHAGTFAMGALSALIVGPCVAPPLAGALVYISQTRDVVLGGSALFALASGMSVPLLVLGASAGVLLPRAGMWMTEVKKLFGVIMLGTALWIASPIIPARMQMLLWASLAIGYGACWIVPRPRTRARLAAGLVLGSLGCVQLAGAGLGATDAMHPFTFTAEANGTVLPFRRIATVAGLDAALAGASGKPVMVDFYADWCVACKEMEHDTFTDPRVRAGLGAMELLQIDVTANTTQDQALLKRFGLFGPPGIAFFGPDGREIAGSRIIGYAAPEAFLEVLSRVTAQH